MANWTIGYALALAALGLGGYFGTGRASLTALIPLWLGLAVLLCGVLARQERWRKHAMHAAAVLGLLGFLGPLRVLPQMFGLLAGGSAAHPAAVLAQAILMLLSAGFVALCVKSFVDARRGKTDADRRSA
ncbi:MAG TPA: hypothetical protein VHR45_07015 [Thermoanaerobaculia bacterium]|nr:hypothetical protein [Thermoanaerobaculia bacterium]